MNELLLCKKKKKRSKPSLLTFRTPITAVFLTYALESFRHFCKGASTYSKIVINRKLHRDRRARPRTMGSSLSLEQIGNKVEKGSSLSLEQIGNKVENRGERHVVSNKRKRGCERRKGQRKEELERNLQQCQEMKYRRGKEVKERGVKGKKLKFCRRKKKKWDSNNKYQRSLKM